MRWLPTVCCVFVASLVTAVASQGSTTPCDVTKPNGLVAGSGNVNEHSYGNQLLSVGPFGLWPDGNVVFRPDGPGFITQDGSLGMKFGWTRGVAGQLSVEGHRLDGTARPLRFEFRSDNDDSGFVATSLVFSTPGCWEVTGRVGHASVTFVTMVTKIGDGPSWRKEIR